MRFFYWVALALLRLRLAQGRLLMTCGSSALARSVGRAVRAEVALYPVLKSYPVPAARDGERAATIGFLGSPQAQKGEPLLATLVDACARSLPASRIVVQQHDPRGAEPAGWPANVEVLPVGLDRNSYFKLLNRIDVAVLPYQARNYGSMVSGVFAEALACGCATVVPAGTWMAEMLDGNRGAGVVFDDFSVEAIAEAVMRAVADLDRLLVVAGEAVSRWRASQSIGAYVDRLLKDLRVA